jgi:hypothetical protein
MITYLFSMNIIKCQFCIDQMHYLTEDILNAFILCVCIVRQGHPM